jgi:hypothetical protein
MVINDEVAALRDRGYRDYCLVGASEDGWLENRHQNNDTTKNIDPSRIEKPANFALK